MSMSAMRRYLGEVAAALLMLGTLTPCGSAQGVTGQNVIILLKLGGDSEALAHIGSCLASKLPNAGRRDCYWTERRCAVHRRHRCCERTLCQSGGCGDFSGRAISPADQGGRGRRCPAGRYPLLYAASAARAC